MSRSLESVSFDVQQAHEAVASDPDLSPAEKETTLRFANDQDQATVYTENKTLMQDLLLYPHFEVTEVRVSDSERFGVAMSPEEWQADGGPITGLKGYLPLGCLKLPAGRRAEDWVSLIVSDYAANGGGGDGG